DEITEARLPTEPNAVQLMTIHQSKGLEFSVVFVANLTSEFSSNVTWIANRFDEALEFRIGDKHSLFKTKNFDTSKESENAFLADEKKRLMYVALTRAKNILVLPAPSEGDKKTFMEFVAPLFEHEANFESFSYTDEVKSKTVFATKPIQKSTTLDLSYLKNIPAGLKRVTATEEKEEAITISKKPYPFLTRPKLGISFHTYIERHPMNQNEVHGEILNQIATEALIDANDLKELAVTFLQSDLFKRIKASKNVLREIPFSYFDKDLLVEGYIDLMFEENGKWDIVDLKTDQISESELSNRASIYKNQLDIYETALKKLNMAVGKKILYFVRLDKAIVV
ncbi:MAG TPA: 3'-5' exonuclease, partial [Pseudobdellovibrionaceae bacterium]|nr:3'-5' exonuclease [Pseudobdellovibrionaceae bacterium]